MERKTVYIDDETSHLIETHDLNFSEQTRRLIKENFGAIKVMEERRDELETRLDRLLKEKQEIEREMRDVEKKANRLDNLLTKSDVMQRIKQTDEYRAKFEEKIRIIRRAKKDGDTTEEIEQYIERNAEVLSNELPFGEEELEDVLRGGVEAGDIRT